ncbi:MAG: SIMPL domain-containing protein, partial [Burkholderiales bacterium]
MTRLLAAVVLVLLSATAVAAQTTAPPPASEGPVVVASGEATVKRAPDRAWITVTAESRAKNPREAQKMNADVMSAVLQKLRGAGLPAEAIQTRAYDLQPEYDYNEGRQRLRGYLARNSVEVRVDELSRVGELLDLAVTSGATSVGGVRFDLKDRDGAEREALRLAVDDARKR